MIRERTTATKIFLGGLSQLSLENEISTILSPHATILAISLKRRKNRPNGKCLGHGILETNNEGAQALLRIKHFEYRGRKVTMTPYLEGDQLSAFQSDFSSRRVFLIDFPHPENQGGDHPNE
jgi:hypothetical protein